MVVDGKSVAHPCAGRDLLYRSHVDATYVTRLNNELTIMTVDGSQPLPSEQACMRLAPDSVNGKEVSRMVVPNDPNLAFLGQPGRILWHAPAHLNPQWQPIWAGFGAFDPTHEWEIPTDFVGNTIQLELVDFNGPGDLEIFNYYPGWKNARRSLSSKHQRAMNVEVGGHGHADWTFTEPGIYALTWKARGMHFNGEVEETKPITQYWLVGSDEQVGLKPGTTTKLNSIGTSAEEQREQMKLEAPANPEPIVSQIGTTPATISGEAAAQQVEAANLASAGLPVLAGGENQMKVWFDSQARKPRIDFLDPAGKSLGENVVVEIPDAALTCLKSEDPYLGGFVQGTGSIWAWVTSATAADVEPNLTTDTTAVDYSRLNAQGVDITYSYDAQRGERAIVGVQTEEGLAPIYDSASSISKALQFLKPKQYQVRYVFSQPGVYQFDLEADLHLKDSRQTYAQAELYFVVGNESINALRKAMNPQAVLLAEDKPSVCGQPLTGADPFHYPVKPGEVVDKPQPAPTTPGESDPGEHPSPTQPGEDGPGEVKPEEPGKPQPTNPPTPGVGGETPDPNQPPAPVPGPGETPDPALPEPGAGSEEPQPGQPPALPADPGLQIEPTLLAAMQSQWGNAVPQALVQRGHMDLALGTTDKGIEAYLLDQENPTHQVRRDSATFAFAVRDEALSAAPPQLVQLDPSFAGKTWLLPQVQKQTLPWLGFSTQGVDRSALASTQTKITLAGFSGPGRMVTYHQQLDGGVEIALDSQDANREITYLDLAHDHQNFRFTKPGLYTADFKYWWTSKDGQTQTAVLRAHFLVGDSAVDTGESVIGAGKVPGLETPTPPKPAPVEPQPTTPGTDSGDNGDQGSQTPGGSDGDSADHGDTHEGESTPTPPVPDTTKPDESGVGKPNEDDANQSGKDPSTSVETPTTPGTVNPPPTAPTAPNGSQPPAHSGSAPAPVAVAQPVVFDPATVTSPAPLVAAAPVAGTPLMGAPQSQPLTELAQSLTEDPLAQPPATAAPTPVVDAPVATGVNDLQGAPLTQTATGVSAIAQGSWLSGFVLGVGLMSLVGGVALMVAARRKASGQ